MPAERLFTARQRSAVSLERRADKPALMTGYAAVFYRAGDPATEYELWSGCVERIMPGAYAEAIRSAADVRALFNHDSNYLLGRTASGTCRLVEDAVGLRFEIDLPDTQAGRDVAVSVERGDLTGCSFSFAPDSTAWSRDEARGLEVREVQSVRLFDVGPVTYPAYKGTSVALRSEDSTAARTEWEARQASEADAVKIRARLVALDLTAR